MKYIALLLMLCILVSGCAKVYVCYDGTTQKIASRCPVLPQTELTEQEAGRIMDNYGSAMAQAKGDSYTKVNLYQQNATWFANVLFTNRQNQTVNEASFRIDGRTGNVKCLSGCGYVG